MPTSLIHRIGIVLGETAYRALTTKNGICLTRHWLWL
jgi:hypothetical protein